MDTRVAFCSSVPFKKENVNTLDVLYQGSTLKIQHYHELIMVILFNHWLPSSSAFPDDCLLRNQNYFFISHEYFWLPHLYASNVLTKDFPITEPGKSVALLKFRLFFVLFFSEEKGAYPRNERRPMLIKPLSLFFFFLPLDWEINYP